MHTEYIYRNIYVYNDIYNIKYLSNGLPLMLALMVFLSNGLHFTMALMVFLSHWF